MPFELFVLAAVIFIAYRIIAWKVRTEREEKEDIVNYDDDGNPVRLTKIQKEWREKKYEEMILQARREEVERNQLFKEVNKYILENKRPFNLYEWIHWRVQPHQLRTFAIVCTGMYAAYFILFFASNGSMPLVLNIISVAFILMADIAAYSKVRLLEVTEWNPEFRQRFRQLYEYD